MNKTLSLLVLLSIFIYQNAFCGNAGLLFEWPCSGDIPKNGRWEDPRSGHPHDGTDLCNNKNFPIYPFGDGTVITAKWQVSKDENPSTYRQQGAGLEIAILYDDKFMDKQVVVLYGHLKMETDDPDNALLVKVGDRVTKSTVIGHVGNTGHYCGPLCQDSIRSQLR